MAGEGNEEMAMGGVTVGNRTGMVGTGVESQAADEVHGVHPED